jgi:hypothetical protein
MGVDYTEIAKGGYVAGLFAKHRLESAFRGIVIPGREIPDSLVENLLRGFSSP